MDYDDMLTDAEVIEWLSYLESEASGRQHTGQEVDPEDAAKIVELQGQALKRGLYDFSGALTL